MNYNKFRSQQGNLQRLLVKLGVLTIKKIIIKIDNNPDLDISKYQREVEADYFFNNSWSFRNEFQYVFDMSFIKNRLYHYDHFTDASNEFELAFNSQDEARFLNDIYLKDSDWFNENGMEPDIDQFKLYSLRTSFINNTTKKVIYEGSFFGDHETFDPLDWGLYSLIELTGMPKSSNKFYLELIGESYTLYNEKKNKLAYFLAYSAFENFINLELNREDDEVRLEEKINELYSSKFTSLEKHQIYSSVMNDFKEFKLRRNDIAHGKISLTISDQEFVSALFFILTMINSFTLNCSTIDELTQQL